jgi:hypothetical protein
LTDVVAIAANSTIGHSLALKADGTVWTWGYNGAGQLGDGTTTNRLVPTLVPTLADVVAIAAGSGGGPYATPGGYSLALKADGTLWAWGNNGALQLGDGTTNNRSTPVQVRYPGMLMSARAVSSGALHNLLIGTSIPLPPPPPPLNRCERMPWLCDFKPELARGVIELECPMQGCVIVDLLPRNCLVKYDCPGCPAGNCPFHHLILEGLGEEWTVDLRDGEGQPVEHTRTHRARDLILSFLPSAEQAVAGKIGNYMLIFELGPKGRVGTVSRIRTRLEIGKKPYKAPETQRR